MSIDQRNTALHEVAEMVRDLQQCSPSESDHVLDGLTRAAVRSVPGAGYAGITVVTPKGAVETAETTHPHVTLLDEIQRRAREGPCLSASRIALVWGMVRRDHQFRSAPAPRAPVADIARRLVKAKHPLR